MARRIFQKMWHKTEQLTKRFVKWCEMQNAQNHTTVFFLYADRRSPRTSKKNHTDEHLHCTTTAVDFVCHLLFSVFRLLPHIILWDFTSVRTRSSGDVCKDQMKSKYVHEKKWNEIHGQAQQNMRFSMGLGRVGFFLFSFAWNADKIFNLMCCGRHLLNFFFYQSHPSFFPGQWPRIILDYRVLIATSRCCFFFRIPNSPNIIEWDIFIINFSEKVFDITLEISNWLIAQSKKKKHNPFISLLIFTPIFAFEIMIRY